MASKALEVAQVGLDIRSASGDGLTLQHYYHQGLGYVGVTEDLQLVATTDFFTQAEGRTAEQRASTVDKLFGECLPKQVC